MAFQWEEGKLIAALWFTGFLGSFFKREGFVPRSSPFFLIGYHVITAHHFLVGLGDCDEGRIGADAGDLWFFCRIKGKWILSPPKLV